MFESEILIDASLINYQEGPDSIAPVEDGHQKIFPLRSSLNKSCDETIVPEVNRVRSVVSVPKRKEILQPKVKIGATNRVQHYRKAWERNPLFALWLQPGSNSRRAQCSVCESEMSSDVTVLRFHAKSKKHMRSMKAQQAGVDPQNLKYEPLTAKKGTYNPEWENDTRYRSWVMPGSSEDSAYCRLCSVALPAESSTLRTHLATYTHMRAAGDHIKYTVKFF